MRSLTYICRTCYPSANDRSLFSRMISDANSLRMHIDIDRYCIDIDRCTYLIRQREILFVKKRRKKKLHKRNNEILIQF